MAASSIELLEARIAPAGVVTIEATQSGYVITGDAAANDLDITQDGFDLVITPLSGTQILNKTVAGSPQGITTVRLSLYSDVSGGRLGSDIEIALGQGADSLTLEGLKLPGNLSVDMGEGINSVAHDALTLTNISVAEDLDLESTDGTIKVLERLYVGLDAFISSDLEAFTVDAGTFYVGSDLTIEAQFDNDTDLLRINTASFHVYDDFRFLSQGRAPGFSSASVTIAGDNIAIGGDLFVNNGGRFDGDGALGLRIQGQSIDVGGEVIVENFSVADTANFQLTGDVIRLNDGLIVTSTSTASSDVFISGDIVIVDGPVTAQLTKSGGSLELSAHHLTVFGGVNFASAGPGILFLEGDGDIFGKVTAFLGDGRGDITVFGAGSGELFIDGLTVKTPAKLPVQDSGVKVKVADVAVLGKVKLLLGSGADDIRMNNTFVLRAAKISTGAGNDRVELHTEGLGVSDFRGPTSINLGSGDDTLLLGREEAANASRALFMYGSKKFNGGSGTDLYPTDPVRNVQFLKSPTKLVALKPLVVGFESTQA